jgi:hypothetical protein
VRERRLELRLTRWQRAVLSFITIHAQLVPCLAAALINIGDIDQPSIEPTFHEECRARNSTRSFFGLQNSHQSSTQQELRKLVLRNGIEPFISSLPKKRVSLFYPQSKNFKHPTKSGTITTCKNTSSRFPVITFIMSTNTGHNSPH